MLEFDHDFPKSSPIQMSEGRSGFLERIDSI